MYESELALRLTPYVAGEQPKNRKFIKLNTNENPYPPSPRVAEVLRSFDAASLRLYPDMDATALREAISAVEGIPADWVFCGNGSDEVLAFAFAAFFAGKTVAIPAVTYSFYPVYANLYGAKVASVPMKPDFSVDVDGLRLACPIALANPNAPTGIALPLDVLRDLAAYTRDCGEVLLIDEAYAAFAEEGAVPLLMAAMRRIRDSFNSYPVDRLAQAAAREAELDTAYTARIVATISHDRDICRQALADAGIPVLKSRTNFLFVKASENDAAPIQQLLRDDGILVRHFSTPLLRSYLRVTIGTTEDMRIVTERLISRIKG